MNTIGLAGLPGGSEILIILFIILLLFGAKKLPELSRSLGKSLGEFKKGKQDLENELRDMEASARESVKEAPPKTAAADADFPKAEREPKEADHS